MVSSIESRVKINLGDSTWTLNLDGKDVYISSIVAGKIDKLTLDRNTSDKETLRNNLFPQKVGIFVWKTVEHAIFSCRHVKEIWEGIFKWWGSSLNADVNIDNLFHGVSIRGLSGQHKKIWQAIEWVTGYLIWKNRNLKEFQNDSWSAPKVISEVQVKVFEWINNRSKNIHYDWHQWLLGPNNMGLPRITNRDPG
ncbi:uncharacterized protein [Rutidosis leptorrhynchoides]|uniref:uncharacterized protein n=1 Tax=Rutidosis leptorrhynchoides TaxID=125765 RepID=UPI003A98EDB0